MSDMRRRMPMRSQTSISMLPTLVHYFHPARLSELQFPILLTSNGHFSINSHFISDKIHIADRIVTYTEYKILQGP